MALREEVKRHAWVQIVDEKNKAYDLQSNAAIENVVQIFEKQFRTLRGAGLGSESTAGIHVSSSWWSTRLKRSTDTGSAKTGAQDIAGGRVRISMSKFQSLVKRFSTSRESAT